MKLPWQRAAPGIQVRPFAFNRFHLLKHCGNQVRLSVFTDFPPDIFFKFKNRIPIKYFQQEKYLIFLNKICLFQRKI